MAAPLLKSGSGMAQLKADLARLQKTDVLVGIPADKALRPKQAINNASLLYLHTHGSPLRNIPARPVLEPAIKANYRTIDPHLKAAAKAVLEQKPQTAEHELQLAGIAASNAAKRWFTDPQNGWAPNAPATIKAKGSDRPLIDTGQLRAAITWVVRFQGAQAQAAKTAKKPGFIKELAEHSAASLLEAVGFI